MRANLFLGCPGEVMNDFRILCGIAGLALLSAVLSGCGGDTPRAADKAAPAKAAKKTAPTVATPAAVVAATPIRKPGKAAPALETKPARKVTVNPFQMPEIPEEFLAPKEEPTSVETAAPVRPFERPKVRLLGFSDVDGFRALVELKGDVLAVEEGDLVEGVQIVSIKPPSVTFQFANSNWSTKLFDQPWSNQQTGVASNSGQSRPAGARSRSTPRRNPLATNSRSPLPGGRLPLTSIFGASIPKLGGNSGTPYTADTPAGNGGGAASIPGMPAGGIDSASGIPGLPGPAGNPGAPPASAGMTGGTSAIPSGSPVPSGPLAMPGIPSATPGGASGFGGMPGGIN